MPVGRQRCHVYPVVARGRGGVCFAHTYWGNDRIRWYWVRFPDGSERAYSAAEVAPA